MASEDTKTVDTQEEKISKIRHSTAHVMAEVVLEMFPGTKIAIGPTIEAGFYYDFDLPDPLTEEDLQKIEERMLEIIRDRKPFTRKEVGIPEAREILKEQPYKQ